MISKNGAKMDIDMVNMNIKRAFSPPKSSYFLFGPRGTGKTTWLKNNYKEAIFIDLLKPEIFREYSARPEIFRDIVHAYPTNTHFIIDEVQKLPELLDVVHGLIEENKNWHFILTGSSARKLKRSGTNLLAGRALLYHMHPFIASEVGEEFSIERALSHGMVPLVSRAQDPENTLKSYIGIYLKEEIQQEGIVRNIGNFSRFLETMSFSQTSILNLSNIATESSINRKVIENYLRILEDLLLSFRLPSFSKKAKRATIAKPKFYFFDCGVYHSLRPKGPLDKAEEIQGQALETLVAQHLKAWCDYSSKDLELFFWRTKRGLEVDFILYGEKNFYAIEVKNSTQIRPQDLKGLKAFCEEYEQAMPLLLYRGDVRVMKGNILCLPIKEFLLSITPSNDTLPF